MNKTTTSTILAGALLAGSLAIAPTASAAPAATPTAVVKVQEATVQVQESRFPKPTKGQRIRAWVCNLAPSICR